ncbi:MAG TPA: HIT family protein [Labilithrix sp.]|nr:HIT family protein [Labilithrix sp.]
MESLGSLLEERGVETNRSLSGRAGIRTGRVGCIFCDIAAKKLTAHVVFEDDVALAFLDKSPLFVGHVLVVPRSHVVTLPELPAESIGPFFERVQSIARAMPKALGAQGTFVAMNNIVSQSVAHLHVHVVPRTKGDGLKGFFWPRTKYKSDDQMHETAEKIRPLIGV